MEDINVHHLHQQWLKGEIPFDPILKYFEPTIKGVAKKYARVKEYRRKTGYDFDDWVSHGYNACYDSCTKYNKDNEQNNSLNSYVFQRLILEFNGILYRKSHNKYDDSEYIKIPLDKVVDFNGKDEIRFAETITIPNNHGTHHLKMFELDDLCDFMSLNDEVVATTLKMIARGYTVSESARKQDMRVGTLDIRMKRHKTKLEKKGITLWNTYMY